MDDPICGNDILFRKPLPRPGALTLAAVPSVLPLAATGKLNALGVAGGGVPGLAGGGVPGQPGF